MTADRYWGGYTEHGELLHLAVSSSGMYARSACGLFLTGGAHDVPPDVLSGTATCRKCDAASREANTEPLWRGKTSGPPSGQHRARSAIAVLFSDVEPGTEVEVWPAGDRTPPEGLDTDEYRAAVQHAECPGCRGAFSDSDHTIPMQDWHDKPHRLVYDLCREIDRLRAGDRTPTREQIEVILSRRWGGDGTTRVAEATDELLALLHGQGDETDGD